MQFSSLLVLISTIFAAPVEVKARDLQEIIKAHTDDQEFIKVHITPGPLGNPALFASAHSPLPDNAAQGAKGIFGGLLNAIFPPAPPQLSDQDKAALKNAIASMQAKNQQSGKASPQGLQAIASMQKMLKTGRAA